MSFLRSLSATLLSAATTFSLVTASGCGTSAMGVDDCRDIQQARCRAGKSCGLVDDAPACERYYRDHCLHGLSATPPAGASVAACVNVIEAAGRCAAADAESTLADCPDVTGSLSETTSACEVVQHPERAGECAFLTDVETPDDGSAGQGAGGASGEGASAGTSGIDGSSTTAGQSTGGAPVE